MALEWEALFLTLNKTLPAAQLREFDKWTSIKEKRSLSMRNTDNFLEVRTHYENTFAS